MSSNVTLNSGMPHIMKAYTGRISQKSLDVTFLSKCVIIIMNNIRHHRTSGMLLISRYIGKHY